MKNHLATAAVALASAAVFATVSPHANAQSFTGSFTLSPTNEVHSVTNSTATGSAEVVLSGEGYTNLSYTVQFTNLTSIPVGAHFHIGAPGVAGGIRKDISAGLPNTNYGTITGAVALTEGDLAEVATGNWYLNIHTVSNANGEIRGQVPAFPHVRFSTNSVVLALTNSSAVLTVVRGGALTNTVTVDYATVAGTATTNAYTNVTGTLTFTNGVASQTITVPLNASSNVADGQFVFVDLTSATNAILIEPSRVQITFTSGVVTNPPPPPTSAISAIYLVKGPKKSPTLSALTVSNLTLGSVSTVATLPKGAEIKAIADLNTNGTPEFVTQAGKKVLVWAAGSNLTIIASNSISGKVVAAGQVIPGGAGEVVIQKGKAVSVASFPGLTVASLGTLAKGQQVVGVSSTATNSALIVRKGKAISRVAIAGGAITTDVTQLGSISGGGSQVLAVANFGGSSDVELVTQKVKGKVNTVFLHSASGAVITSKTIEAGNKVVGPR